MAVAVEMRNVNKFYGNFHALKNINLSVAKGGRQGCRFGGILLNLSYARAFKMLHKRCETEDIPIRTNCELGQHVGCKDQLHNDEVIALDVTFVDDGAIVIVAMVPAQLRHKLNRLVQILIGDRAKQK